MLGLGLTTTGGMSRGRAPAWTPARLFSNGEQGVWYEPKPKYLFTDAAGTVPVTADGDPVGYMQDLSGNGNHATQSTSAARPIYRTDGVLHWLEFDGVDDHLLYPSEAQGSNTDSNTGVLGSRNDGSGFYSTGAGGDYGFVLLNHETGYRMTSVGGSGVIGNASGLFASGTTIIATGRNNRSAGLQELFLSNGYTASESYTPTTRSIDNAQALGSRGTQLASVFKGAIFGYILVNKPLSDNDKARAEAYIANLAGVTL